MPTVADVMRRHGTAYLERFGAAMPAEHKKVLQDDHGLSHGPIGDGALRMHVLRPPARHGAFLRQPALPDLPTGQDQGLARDPDRPSATVSLLPADLHRPGCAGAWIRSHQRIAYAALFEASSEAIKTLAADPKYVGSRTVRFLRRAAHLGAHSGLSPSRSLRRARRRHQCRRPDMAAIPCPFLRGGPSAVDSVSRQVPRCSRARRAVDRSRSRGVASRLGSPLAGRRRRPGFLEVSVPRTSFG